jgi:hypothetical protein
VTSVHKASQIVDRNSLHFIAGPAEQESGAGWRGVAGVSSVNVRGTTRLTSAAIGEVVNRICDVVIWLMSANACTAAFSFAAQNESHVCLELLSQKLKKAITDKRGCDGNSKIGSRENIS